ncbi:MAG: glycosyltransferase family 2 protein [Proteobacteria bacterium]|nr:glycosyltransferase family 2 protein [Pseudomonadota bacterium]
MSFSAEPLVSIGMPLYNEARFLAESLASIQAQDHPNLEIILSDNGSTDATWDLCKKAEAHDPRVRIHRFETNRGVATNFQNTLDMARGKYFIWAAGHDRWSPNMASACASLLESLPTASLAVATSRWMDEEGQPMARESGYTDTRGMDPISRFFTVLWGNMHPVLGLMRKSHLDRSQGVRACAGADLILLAELALQGDFLHVPEAHWERRMFRKVESHQVRIQRYKSREFGLSQSLLDRLLPLARLPLELTRAVLASDLSRADRSVLLMGLFFAFPVRYLAGRRYPALRA